MFAIVTETMFQTSVCALSILYLSQKRILLYHHEIMDVIRFWFNQYLDNLGVFIHLFFPLVFYIQGTNSYWIGLYKYFHEWMLSNIFLDYAMETKTKRQMKNTRLQKILSWVKIMWSPRFPNDVNKISLWQL